MTAEIASITFDASNASELADFWSGALDRPVAEGANQFFARIEGAPMMMFIAVPEEKTAKNRCHLDLTANNRAEEVERLKSLGAEFVHEKEEFGIHWVTMRDPQGNEFCVSGGE